MGDPELLTITVDERGPDRAAVVVVDGQLDFGTTPHLLRVATPLTESARPVVLDLAAVSFCDSSGLSALVRLHKSAAAAGGSLTLARPRPQVAATIAATALDRLFTIRATLPGDDGAGSR
ncbi:STAS domain-containing protein [Actinokineospora auranticolor]|uniref:Anti-sigma factor antagonist n=1 Tax=Actinokineospora auranticolor TaxID=155976 RepID=A0A2S6H0K8_9PSEU|nr:STAS domain-containing protein [Actinokineospora auranticolor]PPK70947.1 anti-sigma B factor antagonist [Actinokineospora auranticolor]